MICAGQVLNDTYEIRERIGSGGGGIIYKAYHRRMRKNVAIKLIKDDIRGELRNRSEVDVLKNLKNNYLPQVLDFVEDGNDVYTVMEFVEGQNFKQLISSGRTFNEVQVRKYALQLCEAVEYLHNHIPPIIHSDIKPANIMLTPQDNICLIDFNISMMSDNGVAVSKGGSKDFGAPEQFKRVIVAPSVVDSFHEETRFIDEENTEILIDDEHISRNSSVMKTKDTSRAFIDVRTDIYGIGASVYYMLTSRIPSGGHLDFRGIKCSESLKETVIKAMNPIPSKRFSNIGELKKAFKSKFSFKPITYAVVSIVAALGVGASVFGFLTVLDYNKDKNAKITPDISVVEKELVDKNYEQAIAVFDESETTANTEITVDIFSENTLSEYEMPVEKAVWSNGLWGQSISYRFDELNAELFKDETEIRIEFEVDGEQKLDKSPVELIFQNTTVDPQIWAKISPFKYDNSSASFSYDDMITSYGSDNFFGVDYIHIGDCGTKIKVTKFIVSGINLPIIPDYNGLTSDEYIKLLDELNIGHTVIYSPTRDVPDGYVINIDGGEVGGLYSGIHNLNVYKAAPLEEETVTSTSTQVTSTTTTQILPLPAYITIQGETYSTSLTELNLHSGGLHNPLYDFEIEDLDKMVNLTYLNLHGNEISDIYVIRNLKNLEELRIDDNRISDISSLSNLSNLRKLEIQGNKITDITPLSNLIELRELNAYGNDFSDISALSNMKKLEKLNLANTHFGNTKPLKNLTNLTRLDLRDTQISDISSFSSLKNLTYLDVAWNQISDITPLENCTNLTKLYILENSISDISPLSNLDKLTSLIADNNNISNIEPLSNLSNIEELWLSDNKITDISALSGLTNLKSLWIFGNSINDLRALSNLNNLEDLHLQQNQISDISPLMNMKNLKSLSLYDNPISEEDIDKLRKALPNCNIGF